jgi:hypothetical protein
MDYLLWNQWFSTESNKHGLNVVVFFLATVATDVDEGGS